MAIVGGINSILDGTKSFPRPYIMALHRKMAQKHVSKHWVQTNTPYSLHPFMTFLMNFALKTQ